MTVVDDIKARLDIVDVVSPYATLQKSGGRFKANCPFHDENTPSFVVNPDRQSWHCFGACSTGGDAFSFVMQAENIEFGQALRLLAQRTGIQLQQRSDSERAGTLHRINRVAANFYRDALKTEAGKQARSYINSRHLRDSSVQQFLLGYSPESGDALTAYLLTHDFKIEDAIEAGLVRRDPDDNREYDFFRNRLMFPIFDRRGNISGFGARALDDSNPKYINTAATPIFDKRATLYALNFATDSIRDQRAAVVVEGYMDAIAAHEFGYANVVASMGTALTQQQVTQLRTMADRFVLALDPDAAGQEATLRSLESSWRVIQSGAAQQRQRSQSALTQWRTVDLRIAALPEGLDPDALIRKDSDRWEQIVADAPPLLEFLIPTIASRFDLSATHSRGQVVDIVWPLIAALDRLDQERYEVMLAESVGVSVQALRASIGGGRNRGARPRPESQRRSSRQVTESVLSDTAGDPVEEYTLALLLNKPDLKGFAESFDPRYFQSVENREVFTNWMTSSTMEELWDSIDESLHPHLLRLTQFAFVPGEFRDSERAIAQTYSRLKKRHWTQHQELLLSTDSPQEPPPRELEQEVANVNANIRGSEPSGAHRDRTGSSV